MYGTQIVNLITITFCMQIAKNIDPSTKLYHTFMIHLETVVFDTTRGSK